MTIATLLLLSLAALVVGSAVRLVVVVRRDGLGTREPPRSHDGTPARDGW
ncbi:hypothetical protein [Cellulomonas sp. PhB143]|nr:hypothetical protein [Cellulomonas sp. PhB143]ROS78494.1 hypothetical protein EDF32_0391 [Cellulomonas sp. PhB143]